MRKVAGMAHPRHFGPFAPLAGRTSFVCLLFIISFFYYLIFLLRFHTEFIEGNKVTHN